ncbi:MAG: nickel-dependent lactate racemase [Chloroflexia bacterium]|nr:nickel-dependent lactate racemase [Chloroflexia bacterium]
MYNVPYGRKEIRFDLPPGLRGTVLESKFVPSLEDVAAAVRQAMAQPVGSPRLRDLAQADDTVVIVFTDITRACPDALLVEALLEELHAAGVPAEQITFLCGVGLHRPSTTEEKVVKLGAEVVRRYTVIDHDARDPDMLVDLGQTESGIPLSVNRLAYEADLLIATGIVEPHQYAGYSGGAKTLSVGAAGEAMIAYTHGPHMLEQPGTRLGRIEGNPFRAALNESARRAGLRFVLNVVQDDAKRVVGVRAGDPVGAFSELVELARGLYEVPIPQQYDVVVAGIGFPKDANVYQASRGPTYLHFAPTPVAKAGGTYIVPAPCQEGAGEGAGEQRFYRALKEAVRMEALVERMREEGYPPGQQRAFMVAKVLTEAQIVIVGAEQPEIVREMHMVPLETMEQALGWVQERQGPELDVLVVPHSLLTLPVVQK